jgi:hypothetical protein
MMRISSTSPAPSSDVPLMDGPSAPAKAGPSESAVQARRAPAPAGAVTVESYRGEASRSAVMAHSEPPAGSVAGPSVRAGELAATGGRVGDTTDTYAQIERALSRTATDWVVSDKDCRRVHTLLGNLPPSAFKETLERMDRSGLLERYLAEMPPELRSGLVQQCEAKGLLSRASGRSAPQAPGSPPDAPCMLRNSKGLPAPLQVLVHQANVASAHQYRNDYGAYVERYAALVEKCRHPLELRRLGDVVGQFSLSEPGGSSSDARFHASFSRHGFNNEATRAAQQAKHAKVSEFRGEQRPGTFAVHGSLKAEAKVEAEHFSSKLGTELSLKLTQDGQLSGGRTLDAEVTVGRRKHGVSLGSDGVATRSEGISVKHPAGKLSFGTDSQGKAGAEVKVLGNGVGASTDARSTTTLEVSLAGVDTLSRFNSREGTMEVGAKRSFEFSGGEVEVSGSVSFQGARPERAGVITRGYGLFGSRPELDARTPWSAIPEPRRKELTALDGWSERTWREALQVLASA